MSILRWSGTISDLLRWEIPTAPAQLEGVPGVLPHGWVSIDRTYRKEEIVRFH